MLRYIAFGSITATINIIALSGGFYHMTKLIKDVGMTAELGMETGHCKENFGMARRLVSLFLPIILQVVDSVLDAVYFINLKINFRLVHVGPTDQMIQAVLLLTCKCFH